MFQEDRIVEENDDQEDAMPGTLHYDKMCNY